MLATSLNQIKLFSAAPRATIALFSSSPNLPAWIHTSMYAHLAWTAILYWPIFLLFFLLLVTVSLFRKRQNLFCRHNFYERNRTNFLLLPHQQSLALPNSSMIVFVNYWSFQIIIYSKRNIICHNRALLWKAYPNHIKLFPQRDEHLFFSVPGVCDH